mgnify:CR=1 FL=1
MTILDKLSKFLLYILILTLIPAAIIRIQVFNMAGFAYPSDLIAGLLLIPNIINFIKLRKYYLQIKLVKYLLLLYGILFLSIIFSPFILTVAEKITSVMYLLRFITYSSVLFTVHYLYTKNTIKPNVVIKLFLISAGIVAFFGWIEYFLYPNLRNLSYLGWDPHYKRIFSSFLDPNFLGLFMVLSLLMVLLCKISRYQKFILGALFFFTLMFTYSRGSYLTLIITLIFYFIKTQKPRYILVIFLLMAITAVLLPRPSGEGVRLERLFSITERLENWKLGWKIFADHPILGVGFNAIRYVKISYQYPQDNLLESHSGAGLDNSFLLVAATSGIIGLIVFLLILFHIYAQVSMLTKASLLAIVVHSLFVNSYFYPWVMVWLWIMIGVTMKK